MRAPALVTGSTALSPILRYEGLTRTKEQEGRRTMPQGRVRVGGGRRAVDPTELEHVQALLAEAGLAGSTLVPRRLRPARA
jgi:hypothetical protein